MIKIKIFKHDFQPSDLTITNFNKLSSIALFNFIKNKYIIDDTVKNNKLFLINLIRTKIFNLKKIKPPEIIIYNFIFNLYLSKLGNCHLIHKSINNSDLDTQVSIFDIPLVYLYCINDNNEIYSFDIRTIHNIYLLDNTNNKNPYTRNIIPCNELLQIKKKIDFLNRNGFIPYHFNYLKKICSLDIDYNNIIYKLHLLDYDIKKEWIFKLSILKLKKLYYNMYNLWSYANLSDNYKNNIINSKNGNLFFDSSLINTYKQKDKHKIIHSIFNILNRFISEGTTDDHKQIGALYFLTALIEVCPNAKKEFYFLVN